MPDERRIECSADAAGDRGEILRLRFGDKTAQATLRIDRLSARLVATLPPRALDLIEIAAFVYVADAAIKRGSLNNSGMGQKWRRHLLLEIPVREPDLWSDRGVSDDLAKLLSLLSDDVYSFAFTERNAPEEPPSYLDLNPQAAFKADEAMLFSGGLDSFAGALEETLGRKHRVVLVSHHSSTTLHHAQSNLIRRMEELVGERRLLHAPLSLQVRKGDNVEATHRSRSFSLRSCLRRRRARLQPRPGEVLRERRGEHEPAAFRPGGWGSGDAIDPSTGAVATVGLLLEDLRPPDERR